MIEIDERLLTTGWEKPKSDRIHLFINITALENPIHEIIGTNAGTFLHIGISGSELISSSFFVPPRVGMLICVVIAVVTSS